MNANIHISHRTHPRPRLVVTALNHLSRYPNRRTSSRSSRSSRKKRRRKKKRRRWVIAWSLPSSSHQCNQRRLQTSTHYAGCVSALLALLCSALLCSAGLCFCRQVYVYVCRIRLCLASGTWLLNFSLFALNSHLPRWAKAHTQILAEARQARTSSLSPHHICVCLCVLCA